MAKWRTMMLATVLTMMALTSADAALATSIDACLTTEEAVFPYWSLCDSPAIYAYSGGAYKLQSQGNGSTNGYYLAPEWDETNSTYYVRLVEDATDAARYEFTHITEEFRLYLGVNDTKIIIINADSGRSLEWRDEGNGQYFLVEANFEPSSAAEFRFRSDDSITLPCPRIANARCGAYNIVFSSSSSSDGLGPYEENGVVYFTLASSDNLTPFTLINSTTTSGADLNM
jgi:hypothetical protein